MRNKNRFHPYQTRAIIARNLKQTHYSIYERMFFASLGTIMAASIACTVL